MTAPSNANTSGLEAEKRLKAIAAAVEFGPGNGIHFREEGAVTLAADIREVFVTAASAQARIAELEARVEELEAAKWEVKHVDTMNDMVAMGLARDSAEARADRLAKALARLTFLYETEHDADQIRRPDWLVEALQQETQP